MKECKKCAKRYYPMCFECDNGRNVTKCDGCGMVVCSESIMVVSDVPKSIRELFFVRDFREYYTLCMDCYTKKYKENLLKAVVSKLLTD